ncbi:unnamed protein product, partial [Brenthis ino]
MWHAPLDHSESSSYEDEGIDEGELSTSSITSADSPNNASFSGSTTTVRYKIPVITSPFLPRLYSSDIVEMNTNLQSPRHRNRNRRSCQRFQPYRISNLFISSSDAQCDLQSSEETNIAHFGTQEESSYRVTISDRSPYRESLSEIQQDTENRTPSLSPDHNLVENLIQISEDGSVISSTLSFEDYDSIDSFQSSMQIESESSHREIHNNNQNLYNSSNEIYIDQVAESLLDSVLKSKDVRAQTLKSNAKTVIENFQCDNESLAPLLRLVNKLPSPTLRAEKLAKNLVKLSRYLKSPNLSELNCLDCTRIPTSPVTGECGHSRCLSCIKLNGACPCGANAPKNAFVNTVVRELVQKMTKYIKKPRIADPGSIARTTEKKVTVSGARPRCLVQRGSQYRKTHNSASMTYYTHSFSRPREPMTVQARHRKARELICAGKFLEAASHLARVASTQPFAHVARKLLAQTITVLCDGYEPRHVWRKLSQSVREQSTYSWLRPSDLECVICTGTFTNPVSTPCGHTYCRRCIERSLYYKRNCALCLGPLKDFSVEETRDTQFIRSILASIDVSPVPDNSNVIPIVTCYVAFPGMPCPLFISDPKYWEMVCRVMESGSRRFGMLAYEEGATYADYGTVLEICDCVVFEDNRCILSTIGVSRFRVLERYVKQGCNVARIEVLNDVMPSEDEIPDIHLVDAQILYKALTWLKNMDESVKEEIETAFGPLPYYDIYNTPHVWWSTADGPHWLWWLITILPLKPEIKILMISTCSLLKRMLAVSRTLDVMNVESDRSVYFSTIREPTDAPTDQRWSMGNI